MDINEVKEKSIEQAELFLRAFSDHFTYNQTHIFDSLLEKPDRYIAEYTKMVNIVLNAFKNEEKVSVNINNNSYTAFFEEVSQLNKKLDDRTHQLKKSSSGKYELIEYQPKILGIDS